MRQVWVAKETHLFIGECVSKISRHKTLKISSRPLKIQGHMYTNPLD